MLVTKENLFLVSTPESLKQFNWDTLKAELDDVEKRSSMLTQQAAFGCCIKNPLPVPTGNHPCFDTLYLEPTSGSYPTSVSSGKGIVFSLVASFRTWVKGLVRGDMAQAMQRWLGALYNVQLSGKTKVYISILKLSALCFVLHTVWRYSYFFCGP